MTSMADQEGLDTCTLRVTCTQGIYRMEQGLFGRHSRFSERFPTGFRDFPRLWYFSGVLAVLRPWRSKLQRMRPFPTAGLDCAVRDAMRDSCLAATSNRRLPSFQPPLCKVQGVHVAQFSLYQTASHRYQNANLGDAGDSHEVFPSKSDLSFSNACCLAFGTPLWPSPYNQDDMICQPSVDGLKSVWAL